MTLAGFAAAWLALLSLPAHALTGAVIAGLVNQRFQNTQSKCFVDRPIYECSGVLLRTAPSDGAGDNFWRLSPEEIAAGAAKLTYIREDLPQGNPPDSVGFVLADKPTAVGDGKAYELTCGCPPAQGSLPPCTPCPSPNTVGVSLWDQTAPGTLAVQAIYYDASRGGQLSQALRYQRQFFNATGRWAPILRALLNAPGGASFGFDERDQLDWGYAVAKQLEARYVDTRLDCPGNLPAYYCSGILIRNTGSGDFHSWNPTTNSIGRNGVSFSFARIDMNMTLTTGGVGLIMRELSAPTQHPVVWRCSFPINAGTASRPDSCSTGGSHALCDARGITTAAQYRNSWPTLGNGCGLSPSAAQFSVLIDLRKTVAGGIHNEVILAAWPQNIPTQLPIETFFYSGAANLPGTQHNQQDYMAVTGRFMPVISVTLSAAPGSIFVYNPADQDGAMLPGAVFIPPGSRSPDLNWWGDETDMRPQ
ncbi:hypothetical protein ACPWR0_17830 [Pandoraea pneumonica]|uniref:hypothetical protein n=1 Tax=Pandoraea pneumonica TaxID=2508299 RepID=UPI003CF05940